MAELLEPPPKQTRTRHPASTWIEIRKASEAGVSDDVLCQRYGVKPEAVRLRRMREGWISYRAIQEKAKELASVRAIHSNALVTKAPSGIEVAADILIQNGQLASSLAQKLVLAKLQKAADNPHTLKDLADVADIKTAMSVARIAGGLDKEGGEVKVNLAMFTGDAQVSDAPAAWEIAGQVVESGPD